MSVTTAPASRGGARVAIQKFGTFLSNMIMPNIAAIIAWGIIIALFIPDGPFPNEKITSMVAPATPSTTKPSSAVTTMPSST